MAPMKPPPAPRPRRDRPRLSEAELAALIEPQRSNGEPERAQPDTYRTSGSDIGPDSPVGSAVSSAAGSRVRTDTSAAGTGTARDLADPASIAAAPVVAAPHDSPGRAKSTDFAGSKSPAPPNLSRVADVATTAGQLGSVTQIRRVRSEREAASRKYQIRRWLTGFTIFAVVVAVGAAGLFTPVLGLRNITVVSDSPNVTEAAVKTALKPYLGTTLPVLSLLEMSNAVENLPWVDSAQIKRSWPFGVTVTVTADVPGGYEALPAGSGFRLYNTRGEPLKDLPNAPADLPQLRFTNSEALQRTYRLGTFQALRQVANLSDVTVKTVVLDDDGLISLELASGAKVIWGDDRKSAEKTEVLRVLLQVKAKVYDVSSPTAPVTK